MQKFKVEKPADSAANQLLDDFNDELGGRGEDSDNEELSRLVDTATQEYKKFG